MIVQDSKAPFEYTGGHISLDFVDTVNGRTRDVNENLFTDYDRLLQWSEESGTLPRKVVERLRARAAEAPTSAQSVLRHAIQLREAMYDLFLAIAQRRAIPQESLSMLNRAIVHANSHSEISYSAKKFSRQWVEPESHLDSMLWPVAQAAGELLTSSDVENIRECGSETCGWVFLDKTKNHRRRWCEMKTCGNREKARRYYQRQRS